MPTLIEIQDVHKIYDMGDDKVRALDGVSLVIEEGEYVAIMGPSGSGKSTLMNLVGCLDTPTSGSYKLKGTEVAGMSDDELAEGLLREASVAARALDLRRRGVRAGANVLLASVRVIRHVLHYASLVSVSSVVSACSAPGSTPASSRGILSTRPSAPIL